MRTRSWRTRRVGEYTGPHSVPASVAYASLASAEFTALPHDGVGDDREIPHGAAWWPWSRRSISWSTSRRANSSCRSASMGLGPKTRVGKHAFDEGVDPHLGGAEEELERVAKPRRVIRRFPVMSAPLVPDSLWEAIEPLLPTEQPKPRGGRPRVQDRAALAGIVFVLRTGCPWRLLPKELGCGSGMTCRRRLRDWQAAGVWERLHATLLDWLGDEAALDWSRVSADSVSFRAKRGTRRPAATRSTAASRAPSTTWWWTGTAFPSRSASRPPTPTT